MNFRQSRRVTKRGVDREKRTRTIVDALFISVFLLCLFLTGCSASMTGTPRASGQSPITLVSGETTLPSKVDAESPPVSPATSDAATTETKTDGMTPSASGDADSRTEPLKKFVQQDDVQERVRLVTGWLKFVRQDKAATLVEAGWDRVNAGKIIGPMKRNPVTDQPQISISELMLWRQLVLTDEKAISKDAEKRLETLAVALTTSRSPDDLLHVDNLVVPDVMAGY